MRSYNLHPHMTEKRRAWLEHLRDHGPDRSGSVVGYQCRKLGWTEWFVVLRDGRAMPLSEAHKLFPEPRLTWAAIDTARRNDEECITDAGRLALKNQESDRG